MSEEQLEQESIVTLEEALGRMARGDKWAESAARGLAQDVCRDALAEAAGCAGLLGGYQVVHLLSMRYSADLARLLASEVSAAELVRQGAQAVAKELRRRMVGDDSGEAGPWPAGLLGATEPVCHVTVKDGVFEMFIDCYVVFLGDK